MSSTKEIYREVLEASNRRSFLRKAGLAGMAGAIAPALVPLIKPPTVKAATPSPDLDLAILNFALNLEYLEAEFYLYATTGKGISDNGGTTASGDGKTAGGEVIIKSNPKVPFSDSTVASYATEIAQDEFNHVKFLQSALGAAAVASPDLDLQNSFIAAGKLAGVPGDFDPFANDLGFLLGAFIFEDVGVTAYHGAAPLIYNTAAYIPAAAGILSVEGFHAAEVRAILFTMGQEQKAGTITAPFNILDVVGGISNVRDNLDNGSKDKDQGITDGTSAGAANIVPTDANGLVFSRTTTQVLRIVYGMGTGVMGKPTPGTFFPNGMNGVIR